MSRFVSLLKFSFHVLAFVCQLEKLGFLFESKCNSSYRSRNEVFVCVEIFRTLMLCVTSSVETFDPSLRFLSAPVMEFTKLLRQNLLKFYGQVFH